VLGVTDGDRSPSDETDLSDELMTLTTARVGSSAVVTVTGELDLHTSRELMSSVDDTLAWPDLDALVIDLSGVSFLGSSGLGTLAELATRTPAARRPEAYPPQDGPPVPVRLVTTADNRAVTLPWETMNLQQILPLYPDVAAALTS
jgi:anti-sigma B factor antagonist